MYKQIPIGYYTTNSYGVWFLNVQLSSSYYKYIKNWLAQFYSLCVLHKIVIKTITFYFT